jgi:hypothetical protein
VGRSMLLDVAYCTTETQRAWGVGSVNVDTLSCRQRQLRPHQGEA